MSLLALVLWVLFSALARLTLWRKRLMTIRKHAPVISGGSVFTNPFQLGVTLVNNVRKTIFFFWGYAIFDATTEWTTSRRGQDSPWKSQSEWQNGTVTVTETFCWELSTLRSELCCMNADFKIFPVWPIWQEHKAQGRNRCSFVCIFLILAMKWWIFARTLSKV